MMNLGQYGISVRAIPDTQKIGLETVRAVFELPSSVKNIRSFLEELHRSAGLRSYAKVMFSRAFDCEFCVPLGAVPELQRMFLKLEKLGLVRDIDLKRILWKDPLELRPASFDYSKKEWSFNLRELLATEDDGDQRVQVQTPKRTGLARFDYTDLLMIKELESNAWIKTVDLARKASLPVGDAAYHVNRHVFDRELIRGFKLCWTGSREEQADHSIIVKTFAFAGLSEGDEASRRAVAAFASLPFARSHMRAEDGTYFIEVAFPIGRYPEASQLISARLESVDLNPLVLESDWSCTANFTMPVSLFNKDQAVWIFRVDDTVERLARSARVKSR